ncbi:hypothetical protein KJ359_001306 [Pestalotiopsis sp. 9143b]|nr:hypothetical protein KJ359_001306 [Pestalotiopsis sp. 9143b]
MDDNQRIVLITGCTDGSAGSALARQFQRRGCRVFAAARSLDKMQSLADLDGVDRLAMDVTSAAQIAAAVDAVRAATGAGGRLDVLVNNAAAFNLMPLADQNLDDARAMFDVNVFGPLAVVQAFLPLLLAAASSSSPGTRPVVANIGSVSAAAEPVFQGAYAASKAALSAMSGVMRKELAPLNIRVATVVSGAVATGFKAGNAPWKVPVETSLYAALAGAVESKESAGPAGAMSPDDYAARVVGDLLGANPGPAIYRGRFTTLVWLMGWLGWYGMTDAMDIKKNELDKLKVPEVEKTS